MMMMMMIIITIMSITKVSYTLLVGNYVHLWNKSFCCYSDNPALSLVWKATRPLKITRITHEKYKRLVYTPPELSARLGKYKLVEHKKSGLMFYSDPPFRVRNETDRL